jgi:serine phosphatase RsbU (regulator of sigma subunit)/catechol 2,3-dioxygenase-like lactoylglutathione lyase family enzyme
MSARVRLHHVMVFVSDQERSVAFFREVLGFSLIVDATLPSGERWIAVSPPDGAAVLALVSPPPGTEEHALIGRLRQAVLLAEDVPGVYALWSARGVRFHHPPTTREWGGIITSFEDPDGNSFGLVGFDEVTRRLEAERRAAEEKAENERRAAYEMEVATRVQARLFPQARPTLRTLDYAGTCLQARQVGGDYYDFLDLGGPRVGLVVGDISGKGIAAALLMAHLQASLRSQCAIASNEPRRFLRSVNQLFCQNTPESAFATLVYAEYDDDTRRLRHASCGHPPALLLRRDGDPERLGSTAAALGLFTDWDCATEERTLRPGDVLALYSDGVTEAFDENGDEFGEDRLLAELRRSRDLPAERSLAAVVETLRRFSPREQRDDVTLIVAKVRGVR